MHAADSGCTLSVSIQHPQASVEGLESRVCGALHIVQFPSDPRPESVSSLDFTYSQHAISPSSWEKREFQRTLHLHNTLGIIFKLFMTQTLGMTITLLLQLTNSRPEMRLVTNMTLLE